MIHPSLKLYLRRLTGKKLAGAIAINGKELVPRALPNQSRKYRANSYPEQDGRILKGR